MRHGDGCEIEDDDLGKIGGKTQTGNESVITEVEGGQLTGQWRWFVRGREIRVVSGTGKKRKRDGGGRERA